MGLDEGGAVGVLVRCVQFVQFGSQWHQTAKRAGRGAERRSPPRRRGRHRAWRGGPGAHRTPRRGPMTARPAAPTLPVPLLRDGLAREAARFSLRRLAREMGVSPNGLRDFLRGSSPRCATRTRLEGWLAAQSTVTRPPNVGQFVRLLNELAVDLSPEQTVQLGRAIAALLVESYETRRLAPPRWVQDLLRHYRARRGKAASEVA